MSKISYKGWKYQILSDGYELFGEKGAHITQPSPYNRLFVPDGTDEDNAKAQIDELTAPPAPPAPTDADVLRADMDYMALMSDITLPSEEEEE